MDTRTAKGLRWFKTTMMWAGFFWLFKMIFGFFGHNPGGEAAIAIMSFLGSTIILGLPAFVIGWMTAGTQEKEIEANAEILTPSDATKAALPPSQDSLLGVVKERHVTDKPNETRQRETNADDIDSESDAEIEIRLYATVAEEIDANSVDKGLWTKLFVHSNGDPSVTKLEYIKVRFEQLKAIEASKGAALLQERKALHEKKRGASVLDEIQIPTLRGEKGSQFPKTLYEFLGVAPDASFITIENGYIKQRKLIESLNQQDPEVLKKTELLTQVGNILTNPKKRAAYDKRLLNEAPCKEISEADRAKQEQLDLEVLNQQREMQIKEKYCLGLRISKLEDDFLRNRGATWYM